jgi:hypothetical protein
MRITNSLKQISRYEALLEAFPQLLIQLFVVRSQSYMKVTELAIFSIMLSLFSVGSGVIQSYEFGKAKKFFILTSRVQVHTRIHKCKLLSYLNEVLSDKAIFLFLFLE